MTQQSVAGPFSARHLGSGVWHLTQSAPDGTEIFLRGARPDEPQLVSAETIAALGVEWRADGVRVALSRANGVRHLTADSAIVHEPAPRLYEAVPLAVLDADAKRFWRRVFLLMRIPGGRLLLRLLTRGGRGKGNAGR